MQAISSPFDIFEGICDTDAQGFYQVCILSGVKTVAVECISDGISHPKFDVNSLVTPEIKFEFGFPPVPPGMYILVYRKEDAEDELYGAV